MSVPAIPRAAASACIFRGESVLLVQRGKQPYEGAWSLPGGSIEPGERAHDAAQREVAEETGLVCTIGGFAGINEVIMRDGNGGVSHHYLIAAFWGTACDGELKAGSDARAARFVALGELGDYRLGRRVCEMIGVAAALVGGGTMPAVRMPGIGAKDECS